MTDSIFRELMSDLGTKRAYAPGEVIHLEDVPPNSVYLILEGKVKHVFCDYTGVEKTILILKKGEIFGEVTYFQNDRNMVITRAAERCEVAEIDARTFSELLGKHPELYPALVRLLTKKLRIVMHQVQDLAFRPVQVRVVKLLLRLAEQHGVWNNANAVLVELKVTHQELANMVGAYRSTVTRVINRLRASGLIELREKKVYIPDVRALRSWVDTAGQSIKR